MSIQPQTEIVRRSDGSIDIDFYARRGAMLRAKARAEAFGRIVATAIRALRQLAKQVPERDGDASANSTSQESRTPATRQQEDTPPDGRYGCIPPKKSHSQSSGFEGHRARR